MISDDLLEPEILSSACVHQGMAWNVKRESFKHCGETLEREFVSHPGAVGVLALNEKHEALLIKQYRHAIRTKEWELPAGMLDVTGESPLEAAQRELSEETDMQAASWNILVDFTLTPGGSNEVMRVYLARQLEPTGKCFERKSEEADIETLWVPLQDVVQAVLARKVQNPVLMLAALAAYEGWQNGWRYLAEADEVWHRHERLR